MTSRKSSLSRSLTLAPLVVVCSLACSLAFSVSPALAVFPEAPVTEAPAAVTGTTATLKGELNHGAASETVAYHFAYSAGVGATCTESGLTAPGEAPFPEAGGNHKKVSVAVTGLEGSSTYTVCLIAANPLEPAEAATGTSEVFTTLAAKPVVVSESVSGETPFAVTLNAEVNPENQPTTSCKFEYGTTVAYGKSATCNPEALEGASVQATSAQITGLVAATGYHYRVVVKNATGETKGADGEFTTLPAVPPVIEGESASAQSASATLEATINPQYQETAYTFEYSTTEEAGKLTGTITTLNGASSIPKETAGAQPVSVLTGAVLAPSTTYFYHVVATNEKAEKTEGEVKSFTTVPTPSTDEVKAITTTFAQFHGHLTPLNASVKTQYHFSYNLSTGGGACTGENSTPTVEAGTGPGTEVAATVSVSTLQPGHEYTVCFVTSNIFGSAEGPPVHFTTAAVLPRIVTLTNSAPTTGEATLEGVINPNNQETTYVFEYATSEAALLKSEGTKGTAGSLPAEFAELPVTQALSGLAPDTTYYYRLITKNPKGETTEADSHFSTQGPPLVTTGEAQNVTSIAATLTGTVYPGGLLTTYTFLYVPAAEYEPLAANPYAKGASFQAAAGPDSTVHPVFDVLAGLQPSTTYDYTIIAGNEQGGPVTGANLTFTTLANSSASLLPQTALPVVVSPPLPPPGTVFPLLAHPSIAQLDATEAKEGKAVNPQRTLTNAEKLRKALKACHKKKGAGRARCEKRAKKQFGSAKKKGKK